jgi:hypothetical protein
LILAQFALISIRNILEGSFCFNQIFHTLSDYYPQVGQHPLMRVQKNLNCHQQANARMKMLELALKDSGQKDLRLMSAFGPGVTGRRGPQLRGYVNRGASSLWS